MWDVSALRGFQIYGTLKLQTDDSYLGKLKVAGKRPHCLQYVYSVISDKQVLQFFRNSEPRNLHAVRLLSCHFRLPETILNYSPNSHIFEPVQLTVVKRQGEIFELLSDYSMGGIVVSFLYDRLNVIKWSPFFCVFLCA